MRIVIITLALVGLAACSGQTVRRVDEPAAIVEAKLRFPPQAADAMQVTKMMPEVAIYSENVGNVFSWRFTQRGSEYCRFIATVTPDGDKRSKVAMRAILIDDAVRAAVDAGARKPDFTFLCNVGRMAGEETVAAALEGRAADTSQVYDKLKIYVAANPLAIGGMVNTMYDEVARQMKDFQGSPGQFSPPLSTDGEWRSKVDKD